MFDINSLLNGDFDTIRNEANSIDMQKLQNIASHKNLLMQSAGTDHYRLLAWLSHAFKGQCIGDIGTFTGLSSISLGHCEDTQVITWDIEKLTTLIQEPSNVTFRIGDFREDPTMLELPLIMVDVDPHDGLQEKEFHEFFLESGYRGLVLWDDIHLNDPMKSWWNGIQGSEKRDLTSIGHWSGTGLIIYT